MMAARTACSLPPHTSCALSPSASLNPYCSSLFFSFPFFLGSASARLTPVPFGDVLVIHLRASPQWEARQIENFTLLVESLLLVRLSTDSTHSASNSHVAAQRANQVPARTSSRSGWMQLSVCWSKNIFGKCAFHSEGTMLTCD